MSIHKTRQALVTYPYARVEFLIANVAVLKLNPSLLDNFSKVTLILHKDAFLKHTKCVICETSTCVLRARHTHTHSISYLGSFKVFQCKAFRCHHAGNGVMWDFIQYLEQRNFLTVSFRSPLFCLFSRKVLAIRMKNGHCIASGELFGTSTSLLDTKVNSCLCNTLYSERTKIRRLRGGYNVIVYNANRKKSARAQHCYSYIIHIIIRFRLTKRGSPELTATEKTQ